MATSLASKPCRKCGAINRNARGDCRPCARLAIAKWTAENADKVREQIRDRYRTNPVSREKARARSYRYRSANAEKERARSARTAAANPEARRRRDHAYRARKAANGGTLSPGISTRLYKIQRGLCACCGKPLGDDYHLDHIMPLALGGSNTDDNIQLLRAQCNWEKNARHPVDFMQLRGRLL